MGEFLSEVLERSILTHSGDGEPKEHGGEQHKTVKPSPLRNPLPLDIASSDKERNEDPYTTDPTLAQGP